LVTGPAYRTCSARRAEAPRLPLTVHEAVQRSVHKLPVSDRLRAADFSSESRAVGALDARLAAATPDFAAKAELERALALDPKTLGAASVRSLGCAGALCKVALAAATDREVEAAVSALAERFPKRFPSTTVYTTAEGARAISFARASEELDVDASPKRY
jgi:hypothetical protein